MESEKKTIRLESEYQLRIYALPLRQKIIRAMHVIGKPVTAKQIADRLLISPSSARHHLLKLQEIGLVEHDHYESINGIKADYLRISDVTVSIGTNIDDELIKDRESTTRMMLADIEQRFVQALPRLRESAQAEPDRFTGDLLGGIVHMSTEDAKKLNLMIRDFIDEHNRPDDKNSVPWEYAMLLYEAEC